MAATAVNAEQLQSAFEVFNRQSGLLEQSYRDLQLRVTSLNGQLRKAQSQRLAELVKKERLSQHLTHLLESLPGAIVVIDGDGIIREQNSEASQLLDRPLIGQSWAAVVGREVRDGGSEDGNIQLRDGRWLSLSRRPLQQEPGEVLLLADVTESREIAKLRERQERLTCIGEMTAKFAHQVRTPLASAMLYAGQLDVATPQASRIAAKITARLQDLGRMVNDMLGFAAGARQTAQCIGVSELLHDVVQSVDAQLGEQTCVVIEANDESLRIHANKDALKGALLNLVTNADQACAGSGRIVLGATRNKEFVNLTVTDDGPGIAADVMPNLFRAFFTTRPQGTGLGLAVVHAVATDHGGEVQVESSESGSVFTVQLPAADDKREDLVHG